MKQHTILIVDDAAENIDQLVGLLKNSYELKAARDGAAALRIAGASPPPDLILLDVLMPGMSGHDVCRKLKADKKTRDIPVIFLTAAAETDSLVKGFELGGVDYIVKPFSPVELRTRLHTHLSLRDAMEQLRNQNQILEGAVERKTTQLREKNDLLKSSLGEKEALLHEALAMDVRLRESFDMLNRLYHKVQVIQEEERKNIAMEIHDRLGQLLTAVKLNLFQARDRMGNNGDGKTAGKIRNALELADDAIKAAQTLSLQLRPDMLDNLGFLEAVRWYCRTMQEASGVEFRCDANGPVPALDKRTELSLYRVIQEAATNVLRHARAKSCRIGIEGTAGTVRIVIRDDGVGIDPVKLDGVHSLGIYGMRKRIDDAGGRFRIGRGADGGTTIDIEITCGGGTA